MRHIQYALLALAAIAPALLRADVTIRYKTEIAGRGLPTPSHPGSRVIRMKGTLGMTEEGNEIMIIDFARRQVTLLDTANRTYATVSASDYGRTMADMTRTIMPQSGPVADILKSMKSSCDTQTPPGSAVIAGVQSMERDVVCTMTMALPANMPAMSMKIVTRHWLAEEEERRRVPGLWQLSDFETAQQLLLPAQPAAGMMPEGMKPMLDAMAKGQSITLRSITEMYMNMPGSLAGAAASEPITKMTQEMTEVSSAPIDDSVFSVPGGYTEAPVGEVMNGVTQKTMRDLETRRPNAGVPAASAAPAIPGEVKAYVPKLVPVIQVEPPLPAEARASHVDGAVDLLLTIDSQGGVAHAEALSGAPVLRKAALDAVKTWTYRPVLRDGLPVMAYTDASVMFVDESSDRSFEYTKEMAEAVGRLSDLEDSFPRTPAQKLADSEQDAGGGDPGRRLSLLGKLAVQAADAGADDKATAYASEFLKAPQGNGDIEYDDSKVNAHLVLGRVALRGGDIETAKRELLESAKVTAGPETFTIGPNMTLAAALLKKGDAATVLEYFDLCRKFWTSGSAQLDAWSEAVRKGETPVFGVSLR